MPLYSRLNSSRKARICSFFYGLLSDEGLSFLLPSRAPPCIDHLSEQSSFVVPVICCSLPLRRTRESALHALPERFDRRVRKGRVRGGRGGDSRVSVAATPCRWTAGRWWRYRGGDQRRGEGVWRAVACGWRRFLRARWSGGDDPTFSDSKYHTNLIARSTFSGGRPIGIRRRRPAGADRWCFREWKMAHSATLAGGLCCRSSPAKSSSPRARRPSSSPSSTSRSSPFSAAHSSLSCSHSRCFGDAVQVRPSRRGGGPAVKVRATELAAETFPAIFQRLSLRLTQWSACFLCSAQKSRVRCSAGRPLKVMISGAPASGKGTQCELIVKKVILHLRFISLKLGFHDSPGLLFIISCVISRSIWFRTFSMGWYIYRRGISWGLRSRLAPKSGRKRGITWRTGF